MKTLVLLRHAKSSWEDAAIPDFDRPLNGRGRDAAAAMGTAMRTKGLRFDAILSSPATRAVETLERFARAYGAPLPKPRLDPSIYLASADTLLARVRETADSVARLLIVGHNPGLERLALLLSRPAGPARARLEEKYPTGGLAEIGLDIVRWSDAVQGAGTLLRFFTPRDLERGSG